MNEVRIGTRGSALARAQAAWIERRLTENYPGLEVRTTLIKTSGDRFLDTAVEMIGGKGIFVKEIEEALLRREIDLAVHSMKDLPTEISAGLVLAAIPEREDPRDVLVSRDGKPLKELSAGARVATGSPRRQAQLLSYRKDISVVPIRGNVDTRLKKLDRGEAEALVLAAAGLRRMGLEQRITEYLDPEICLNAVAQGALGLQCREEDGLREKLKFVHHPSTFAEVAAERSFLKRLGGGCQVPVGARAVVDGNRLELSGIIADPQGLETYRGGVSGSAADAKQLGRELAEKLLAQGAARIFGRQVFSEGGSEQ